MTRSKDRLSPGTADSLDPRLILKAIRDAAITHVITVPDTHQQSLLRLLAEPTGPQLITVCTEDEAMGVNLGLYMGGKKPMLLIQNSGFYAALNTVRGLALDGQVPTCMLIGEFFRDPHVAPRDHASRLVRMLEPTLDLWEIPTYRLDHEAHIADIPVAVEHAYRAHGPVALLVGGRTGEVS
ncbi:thiamine pyrophosphate-binding protein [Streptomyces sp. CA-106131]|uniref:thiamine pyrophosphate-binding protein n=1 Tax=Streptomyces sp. CA-106131 TaxID=3240045 RepID=UPI003D943CAE